MAESIVDGRGSGNYAGVTDENRLMVDVSGLSVAVSGTIVIGSVSANVDSVYIQSGNNLNGSFYSIIPTPTLVSSNPAWKFEYITSGTASGVTGSSIGSVTQFIGAGSYVNVLTYSNDFITNVGSWS